VSRSSFFLLLFVAFLAAVVRQKSDGVRLGDLSMAFHTELRADLDSVGDDFQRLSDQAARARYSARALWDDVRAECRTLEADVADDARIVARRISSFINNT